MLQLDLLLPYKMHLCLHQRHRAHRVHCIRGLRHRRICTMRLLLAFLRSTRARAAHLILLHRMHRWVLVDSARILVVLFWAGLAMPGIGRSVAIKAVVAGVHRSHKMHSPRVLVSRLATSAMAVVIKVAISVAVPLVVARVADPLSFRRVDLATLHTRVTRAVVVVE